MPELDFALFSDLHWNSQKPSNDEPNPGINDIFNFHFQDGLDKLEAIIAHADIKNAAFLMSNGDLLDHLGDYTDTDALADLATVNAVLESSNLRKYYSLGNHELDVLSKAEFFANSQMSNSYYSFNMGGYHFVVLDSCNMSDENSSDFDSGNWQNSGIYVNPAQRAWLEADLSANSKPCVIFIHHVLTENGGITELVANRVAVRSILEAHSEVFAVFQGHRHVNAYTEINGIKYFTMQAATRGAFPNVSYAIISLVGKSVSISGLGGQSSY